MKPSRRHGGSWVFAAGLLTLLAGCPASGPEAIAARDASPPHAATLDAREAYAAADRLVRSGNYIEALGYLARIERLTPRTTADFEGSYATALANTAIQAHVVNGMPIPVTRSSVERIALIRESFRRLKAGAGKATSPRQLSLLAAVRAGQLAIWGFAREGFEEYWRGHEIHPLDSNTQDQAGWLERVLRDPTAPVTPIPAVPESAQR